MSIFSSGLSFLMKSGENLVRQSSVIACTLKIHHPIIKKSTSCRPSCQRIRPSSNGCLQATSSKREKRAKLQSKALILTPSRGAISDKISLLSCQSQFYSVFIFSIHNTKYSLHWVLRLAFVIRVEVAKPNSDR